MRVADDCRSTIALDRKAERVICGVMTNVTEYYVKDVRIDADFLEPAKI